MTPEEYRAKWNLPADYPMVAPNYARQRSDFAKQIGLGRKARERVGTGRPDVSPFASTSSEIKTLWVPQRRRRDQDRVHENQAGELELGLVRVREAPGKFHVNITIAVTRTRPASSTMLVLRVLEKHTLQCLP